MKLTPENQQSLYVAAIYFVLGMAWMLFAGAQTDSTQTGTSSAIPGQILKGQILAQGEIAYPQAIAHLLAAAVARR